MRVKCAPGVGPLIDVELGAPDYIAALYSRQNLPLPAPIRTSGLLDTGASLTVIGPRAHSILRLPIIGSVQSQTTAAVTPTHICYVEFGLLNLMRRIHLVTIAQIDFPGFDCLVGRDILDLGKFTYDGKNQVFTLKF